MSTSKTKKLPPGVTFALSDGTISGLTIAELAKQVGKELGVQTASYAVEGSGWIRVAKIGTNPCVLFISNIYQNSPSVGVILSVSGAYSNDSQEARIMAGNPTLFNKVRIVGRNYDRYLELYSHIPSGNSNPWLLKLEGLQTKVVNGTTFPGISLFLSKTEGSIPEGYSVKEFTLEQLRGGVNAYVLTLYNSILLRKKGGRHDSDKETVRSNEVFGSPECNSYTNFYRGRCLDGALRSASGYNERGGYHRESRHLKNPWTVSLQRRYERNFPSFIYEISLGFCRSYSSRNGCLSAYIGSRINGIKTSRDKFGHMVGMARMRVRYSGVSNHNVIARKEVVAA